MSDIYNKDNAEEELNQEPKTLEEYKVLVQQLRQELKQRDEELEQTKNELEQRNVDLEETQTRVSALENAQAMSADANAIFNLQQELDAAKHRESCGDEPEEEQREYIAELHKMLADAEYEARAAKKNLAKEKKKMIEGLQSDKAELVRELYQKTVDLGVKTALLERRT